MPIENERKYVLPPDFDTAGLDGWVRHDIRQAYLDDGPRIRQIDDGYLFTYKKWVKITKELVEIEVEISRDDFELLWSERAQSIEKTRFERHVDGVEWVIDRLRDKDGAVYFVLAEAELPRGQQVPQHVPDAIAAHILYAVAADDNRFTNKKLSDPDYAARLFNEVVAGDA